MYLSYRCFGSVVQIFEMGQNIVNWDIKFYRRGASRFPKRPDELVL